MRNFKNKHNVCSQLGSLTSYISFVACVSSARDTVVIVVTGQLGQCFYSPQDRKRVLAQVQ